MAGIPEYDANKAKQVDAALQKELGMKHLNFKNAKVDQFYEETFTIDQLELDWVDGFYFEGLEAIGLSYHASTHRISGTPSKAGDHPVKLCCKKVGWRNGMPIFKKEFNLIVNPDPRSLWKDLPSDSGIEYYRPDSDTAYMAPYSIEGTNNSNRGMVAASQRGRSHAHEGSPRDDYFALAKVELSHWYVLTVADGAGSAPYSREGARIACNTVLATCQRQLAAQSIELELLIEGFSKDQSDGASEKLRDALFCAIGDGVTQAYNNIQQEAMSMHRSIKDYATTFQLTISKRFEFGWFVAAFWVGDGGIGLYNKEAQWVKILGKPDGGEFAGQTCFLTMPEMMEPDELRRRLRFELFDDFTALVLMTDGITDAKFETDASLQRVEKWNDLWEDLNKEVDFSENSEVIAEQLLRWLDFWSPGNHDDRTIAILY